MYRAAVVLLLFAQSVFAHPNHAGGSPFAADLLHLLSEPDHLAMILLPLVLAGVVVVALRRRPKRARRARS